MIKNYNQTSGKCINCTLYAQCNTDKQAIKHFLEAKKIYCKDGLILEAVQDEV